jgi:hypothetical protein
MDPDFFPSLIPDSGIKKAPEPESGSATLFATEISLSVALFFPYLFPGTQFCLFAIFVFFLPFTACIMLLSICVEQITFIKFEPKFVICVITYDFGGLAVVN